MHFTISYISLGGVLAYYPALRMSCEKIVYLKCLDTKSFDPKNGLDNVKQS